MQKLQEKGIKSAIVSNKPDFAVKELAKEYFGGFVETAVGEKEREGIAVSKGKPPLGS